MSVFPMPLLNGLARLTDEGDAGFTDLVSKVGLSPSKDFRNADLSGADLRNQDLRAFDFSGALFRGALVEGAKFNNSVSLDQLADAIDGALGMGPEEVDQSLRAEQEPTGIVYLVGDVAGRSSAIMRQLGPGFSEDFGPKTERIGKSKNIIETWSGLGEADRLLIFAQVNDASELGIVRSVLSGKFGPIPHRTFIFIETRGSSREGDLVDLMATYPDMLLVIEGGETISRYVKGAANAPQTPVDLIVTAEFVGRALQARWKSEEEISVLGLSPQRKDLVTSRRSRTPTEGKLGRSTALLTSALLSPSNSAFDAFAEYKISSFPAQTNLRGLILRNDISPETIPQTWGDYGVEISFATYEKSNRYEVYGLIAHRESRIWELIESV